MNVKISSVSAMEDMCAQTRPRFICSTKRVVRYGVRTHVKSKGKIPPSGGSDRLVGLVVKASAREREVPGSNPACAGIFSGSSHTSDLKKLALQWLSCQAPGVIGSALGLVGPVSVYWAWVIWKVWSAASISVWQHVKIVCADPSLRYTRMLLGR